MDECKPLAGDGPVAAAGAGLHLVRRPGGVVQVDPIRPTSKAPGIKLLKLKYDTPLSKIAFKFNLHRFNQGKVDATLMDARVPW